MLLLVSPTKTMKLTNARSQTMPRFIKEAKQLLGELKTMSPSQLQGMFGCNEKIAQQVANYNEQWCDGNGWKALTLFDGLQFKSMQIDQWDAETLMFASNHLAIMSGLYGIVHPLDGIYPYRLDFNDEINGIKVKQFYQNKILTYLHSLNTPIIDACSKEYQLSDSSLPRIEVVFLENGKAKATLAKQARGYFARYFVTHKIDTIEQIKAFNAHEFYFDDTLSTESRLVFNRDKGE